MTHTEDDDLDIVADAGVILGAGAGSGIGSLVVFFIGSAALGAGEGSCAGERAGAGAGALAVRVGAGTGIEDGADDAVIAPESRLTSFAGAVFPLKNSDAVSDGSTDNAGGYMSDWNVSDCAIR